MEALSDALVNRSKKRETCLAVLERAEAQRLLPAVIRVSRPEDTGTNAPHGEWPYELVVPYALAYVAAGQTEEISLSMDHYIAFPSANFLVSKGFTLVRESDAAFHKRVLQSHDVVDLKVRSQEKEHVLKWLRGRVQRSKL